MTSVKARKEIIEGCALYLGDCLERLPKLERVDCIITDPPYGDGAETAYGLHNKQIAGNDDPLLNCVMLREAYHCLRKNSTIYNFTNWKHQDFLRNYIQRYSRLKHKHSVVWDKNGIKLGGAFRPAHELILVLEKGKPAYHRKNFSDVQRYSCVQHNAESHPHEKPLALLKSMLAHSTNPGDTVLDPFMGSGSTGVACAEMGRKFIGIELNEKYFDMACRRIEAAYQQGQLFQEPDSPIRQSEPML
jgi:DNA modification methylase